MSEFDAARRAAVMADLLGILAGRPTELLPFEAVRRELGLRHLIDRGVRPVPLDRIVGSLGRTSEFNRAFLPREEGLRARWEQVLELAEGQAGFPPIELYQVGETYFVVDGHHRVSVARSLGAPTIEAHVLELQTPLPLQAEGSVEDALLHRGQAEFLALTGLVPEHPDEMRVTVAHGYERLLEHIRVHGYYRGIEKGRDIPWAEEVASWRASVYRPMVEIIRESGILEEFPGRTEADLYLFTMDHLHHLRELYANPALPAGEAVEDFEQKRKAAQPPRRGWLRRLWRGAGPPS